ncbi:DNA polymerase interacting tetratricopeptide repeat-containing, protein of 47 kDa [Onthophagus taurus]|uniref:DNA polymerase interacting tetratricopeptide repeat-containing, protein of 47 kDa n=1 Tax=Onthophagus taurus TaxID=166361 RepID=UPI0039BDB490
MDNTVKEIKKPMTDEERLELAKKLDKDLDDFINNLPKKKYADGWPEDKWEEEMEKHPFFMKTAPKPGDELHPLYEGLQQLKYDPNENSPTELATSYKDDGNFNFKHKNYRLAILSYTEGIKVKCGDPEIESSLLNNRSAANYYLKNYRSSLRDSELALKIKPDYVKAQIRAANCCFYLNQIEKCFEYCDLILKKNPSSEILKLKKDCMSLKKQLERDSRKKEFENKKKSKQEEALMKEINNRGVKIRNLKELDVNFPGIGFNRVYLNEENSLVWPVIFMYPEYKETDFIANFIETDLFVDHLHVIFENTPDWDLDKKYQINNLNVYYENPQKPSIHKVDVNLTLKEIMQEKMFILKGGSPSFIILVKDSVAEKKFLDNY